MVNPRRLLAAKAGERLLLLGNEAIARGALEAGVQVVTTYPGTPASEIADTLSEVAKEAELYMEYSTNEKVALEVASAASFCGLRSLVSMKHVGLNVASDTLMTLAYMGVKGGLVIVSADDPSCHSSQNEQDNRMYALIADIPALEPSTPEEAKDMVVKAFEISECLELPVLLRTTTRVSHVRGPVAFSPVARREFPRFFEKDLARYVMVPPNSLRAHGALLAKMKRALKLSEESSFNKLYGAPKSSLGVVTCGVSFNYVLEVLEALEVDASILKIGFINPMPRGVIANFLYGKDKVLIIEELKPYLELQVSSIAGYEGVKVDIYGKMTGHLPEAGELTPKEVMEAVAKVYGKKVPTDFKGIEENYRGLRSLLTPRPPVLCPGCPHRASFYGLKAAAGKDFVYPSDIGCYGLGVEKPLEGVDIIMCMGASVGLACGFSKSTKQRVIATIGDSTFLHAAIPALINAVYNKARFTLAVLDNQTTAMTGHQPHPGIGVTGMGEKVKPVRIEDVVRGCGVEFIEVVDPYEVKKLIKVVRRALEHEGPSVIIARRLCTILELRKKRRRGEPITPYFVDAEKCNGCKICIERFGCPAFLWVDGKASVNETLCAGCGVCVEVCPYGAFMPMGAG